MKQTQAASPRQSVPHAILHIGAWQAEHSTEHTWPSSSLFNEIGTAHVHCILIDFRLPAINLNTDNWQQRDIRDVSEHQDSSNHTCAASPQCHSDPAQRWRAEAVQEVSPSVEQATEDTKHVRVVSLISQERKESAKSS